MIKDQNQSGENRLSAIELSSRKEEEKNDQDKIRKIGWK